MDQESQHLPYGVTNNKAQENLSRRKPLLGIGWLVAQGLIGIYVLSYWHLWFILTLYVCAEIIFLIIILLRGKRPAKVS